MLTLKKLRIVFGSSTRGEDRIHNLDWTMPEPHVRPQ